MDKCFKYITQICHNENYDLNKIKLDEIKILIKNSNFNIKNILLNLDNFFNNNCKNIIDYKEIDIDLYDNLNYSFPCFNYNYVVIHRFSMYIFWGNVFLTYLDFHKIF